MNCLSKSLFNICVKSIYKCIRAYMFILISNLVLIPTYIPTYINNDKNLTATDEY